MKHLLVLILAAICIGQSFLNFSCATTIYPIFCDTSKSNVPRNLRTTMLISKKQSFLNRVGLNQLQISGSGQFSEKSLRAMINLLPIPPEKLVVLDLRQESHGFINGNPVSWTDGLHNYANMKKTQFEIESDEYQRLRLAAQAKQIMINPLKNPAKLLVDTVKTEKHVVENYGATYIRLPVTDHNRPTNKVIDQFIELVNNLPPDRWLHMHCKAGKGRTTTFLTLFDIMQNARRVSLKDILARQHLIGGIDLTEVKKNNVERSRAAIERLQFIQVFYLYCREVPNFQVSWSDWVEKQHTILEPVFKLGIT